MLAFEDSVVSPPASHARALVFAAWCAFREHVLSVMNHVRDYNMYSSARTSSHKDPPRSPHNAFNNT